MIKFTHIMKEAAENTPFFIMATADKNGKPNGVPMGLVKIISDDEIMVLDNFMYKTRKNIEENPQAAISFWNPNGHGGFQFKGAVRIETEGDTFDRAMDWFAQKRNNSQVKPKGIVIIKVNEIYEIGFKKDSSINLAVK
jgi:uncharacterized protein